MRYEDEMTEADVVRSGEDYRDNLREELAAEEQAVLRAQTEANRASVVMNLRDTITTLGRQS